MGVFFWVNHLILQTSHALKKPFKQCFASAKSLRASCDCFCGFTLWREDLGSGKRLSLELRNASRPHLSVLNSPGARLDDVTLAAMASYIMDLLYSLTSCMYCFPSTPNLRINGNTYKLLRLLGEVRPPYLTTSSNAPTNYAPCPQTLTGRCLQGGFSYVYLVQDTSTSSLYALKKIRCPFGQESVSRALREVEAYALFAGHPHVIRALAHAVVDARDRADPGSKLVYIVLPYYRRGNLQDAINANLVNRTRFPERRLVRLFVGVARALKALHQYRVRGTGGQGRDERGARAVAEEAARQDADAARRAGAEDGDVEQAPLMESEIVRSQEGVEAGEMRSYAHRDVKPGTFLQLAGPSTATTAR